MFYDYSYNLETKTDLPDMDIERWSEAIEKVESEEDWSVIKQALLEDSNMFFKDDKEFEPKAVSLKNLSELL